MSTNEFICLNPFRPNGKYSIKRIHPKKHSRFFANFLKKCDGWFLSYALAHSLPIQYELWIIYCGKSNEKCLPNKNFGSQKEYKSGLVEKFFGNFILSTLLLFLHSAHLDNSCSVAENFIKKSHLNYFSHEFWACKNPQSMNWLHNVRMWKSVWKEW